MTATIEAPPRMGRRAQVEALLESVPADLTGATITVIVPPGTMPTSSFVDELVRQVLVERRAESLTFEGADDYLRSLIVESASDFGVDARITFI